MRTLAIATVETGSPSETFVRRHMDLLHPGKSIGIALRKTAGEETWKPLGPLHIVADHPPTMVDRIRMKLGWDTLPSRKATLEFLKRYGAGVIMGEYLDVSHAFFIATRELRIPFFAHAHGYDISQRIRQPEWVSRYLDYRECAGVITVSEHSRKILIGIGLPAGMIHTIPCSTDVPEELPDPPAHPGEIRCVAVGRMVPKKAPLLLLEAFRIAADQVPGLRLDFIGGGLLFEEASRFVIDHRLADRVRLHGAQKSDYVKRYLSDADIFVQHSRTDPETGDTEGLPVGVLEAMAQGIPVVSTRHAGIPEAVEEGATGLLGDEGDTEAMAESIVRLAKDESLRRRLGCAGWERARERFTWHLERQRLRTLMGLEE